MKVRFTVYDSSGNELPLDSAPTEILKLASKYHGRELSDVEYKQAMKELVNCSRRC